MLNGTVALPVGGGGAALLKHMGFSNAGVDYVRGYLIIAPPLWARAECAFG